MGSNGWQRVRRANVLTCYQAGAARSVWHFGALGAAALLTYTKTFVAVDPNKQSGQHQDITSSTSVRNTNMLEREDCKAIGSSLEERGNAFSLYLI
jgi:hypothetical protein